MMDTDLTVDEGPVGLDLRNSIETAVNALVPPDKSLALVTAINFDGGKPVVTESFAYRIGGGWSLSADFEYKFGGSVTGKIGIEWIK